MHDEGTLEVMKLARGEHLFNGDGIGLTLEDEVAFILSCDGKPITDETNFDKVRRTLSE